MNIKNKINTYLSEIVEKYDYPVIPGDSIEETILNTIIGTSRTIRLGALPSEEVRNDILNRIRYKIERNEPIILTSAWGAMKTISSYSRQVDLSEWLAINQFHAIANTIKKIYSPGAIVNIYISDSFYTYLYGYDNRIEDYIVGMKSLTEHFPEINIITLSEKSSLIENCDEQCEINFNTLYEYWHDLEDVSINNSSDLISFEKLKNLGWMGEITPAMRDFYIKRMKGLYPNETLEFLTNKVIHFFAYTLFISQNDLMGRKNIEDSTIDVCLLRVPPPNMPKQLYSNRLRMRIAPKKVTNQSAPPWAVGGVLEYNNGNLHIKLLDTKTYNQTSLDLDNINYNNSSISIINVNE